jgi:hypothetical protein
VLLKRFDSIPANSRRVPHISLVVREMWDTTGLALKPFTIPTDLNGRNTQVS